MTSSDRIDLVLSAVEEEQLLSALSKVLGLPPDRVAIIRDVESYPAQDSAGAVCLLASVGGEFSHLAALQLRGRSLSRQEWIDLAAHLASTLGVSLLAPDDGPNPYTMLLLSSGGPPRRVSLDPSVLDDDKYVLLGAPRRA